MTALEKARPKTSRAKGAKRRLKICAVTSTRADWGLLLPLLRAIRNDPDFRLSLIVTGQHLARNAGDTWRQIEHDGFKIDAFAKMGLSWDDSPAAVAAALGRCVDRVGAALAKFKPDLLFVLGDRYEILGAVMAATLARIPVVHNCGGDVTEGAIDDSIRHSISKMSHVHFVTNEPSRRRVCQMGEDPRRVFVAGSSGVELARSMRLMTRRSFLAFLGPAARKKNIVVTFHPETLSARTEADCREMLAALAALGPDVGLVLSGSNADVGGRAIDRMLKAFARSHPNAVFRASLGSLGYLSALKHCDAVVGNSSSGIYEAPSFHTPTVNIGDRQRGRLRAKSVIDVPAERNAIRRAVVRALDMDCAGIENPFGDGRASEKTLKALKLTLSKVAWEPARLLKKTFRSWP